MDNQTSYDLTGGMSLFEQVSVVLDLLRLVLSPSTEIPIVWRPHIQDAVILLSRQQEEIKRIWKALEESVKLQSHYASILNMYDRGERLEFSDAGAWLKRIEYLKVQGENRDKMGQC